MKIAVTGGSGHIGSNLIRALLSDKHQVKALSHLHKRAFDGLNIELVQGGLELPHTLEKLCEGVDVVFHLAAMISIGQFNMKELLKVNVDGTQNMIEACKKTGVKRMVHFSSVHALNQYPLNQPLTEENPLNLDSPVPYERTKAMGEHMVLNSALKNGLDVVIVNPTAVIGPNDFRPSFLGQFLLRLHSKRIPGLVHGGYDWVDARDVARGAIEAARRGRAGERYLLSGTWAELPELTGLIGEVLGKNLRLPMFPHIVARIGVPFIQVWSKWHKEDPLYTKDTITILRNSNSRVSHDKAANELSYHPRPLVETLKDTYQWFKTYHYL